MNEVARIFGARQVAVEAENARAWQDATTNRRRIEVLRGIKMGGMAVGYVGSPIFPKKAPCVANARMHQPHKPVR